MKGDPILRKNAVRNMPQQIESADLRVDKLILSSIEID